MSDLQDQGDIDDKPPAPFKSWKSVYLLVLGNLALLVILFYIFTKVFNE